MKHNRGDILDKHDEEKFFPMFKPGDKVIVVASDSELWKLGIEDDMRQRRGIVSFTDEARNFSCVNFAGLQACFNIPNWYLKKSDEP